MLGNLRRERINITRLGAVLVTFLLVISFHSVNTASAPPVSGDWVILGFESYSNTTLQVNGSLVVAGSGRLSLDNVTLIINSMSDGEYRIQVNQSGVLVLQSSQIRAYDAAFTFECLIYGDLWLNSSTVEDLYGFPFTWPSRGGIQVYGGNLTMNGSNVTKSRANGVHLVQANATLSNCNVSYNYRTELYVGDSSFVNVTSCVFMDVPSVVGDGVHLQRTNNFTLRDSRIRGHLGFGILAIDNFGLSVDNSEITWIEGAGAQIMFSNDTTVVNSTFNDNFSDCLYFYGSRNLTIESNVANDSAGAGFTFDDGSQGHLWNNTASNTSSTGYLIWDSEAFFFENSAQNTGGGNAVAALFSHVTLESDNFYGSFFFDNSTVEASNVFGGTINSMSSNISWVNSTIWGSIPFNARWGSHVRILNTSIQKWEFFTVDYPLWNPLASSEVIIMNFLSVLISDETGIPLQGTDILVDDNGTAVYATAWFGGVDPATNLAGEANWMPVTDRVYRKDYQVPGHPFENITFNTTSVAVSKPGFKFENNPREAEMNASHQEDFTAVPPSPPSNLTAHLSGSFNENVTLEWTPSGDDENGSYSVSNYHLYRGTEYSANGSTYQLVASLANGTYEYVDSGRGENDSNSYFYLICASNPRNFSTCSSNQAGKFSRNLSAGMQLVSIPLLPGSWNLTDVLESVEYDSVWTYVNGDQGPWKSTTTYKPVNDLLRLNCSVGFWINLSAPDRFVVAGVVPSETMIVLHPGWNLIGFPSFNDSYLVQDFLMDTGAVSVEGHQPLLGPYHLRDLGPAEKFVAGEGYWVFTKTESVLSVAN